MFNVKYNRGMVLSVLFITVVCILAGCQSSPTAQSVPVSQYFIPYSSAFDKVTSNGLRTELKIIRSNNQRMNALRRYAVLAAKDKKNSGEISKYIIIAPVAHGGRYKNSIRSVMLYKRYPYYLSIGEAGILRKKLKGVISEWKDRKNYSGVAFSHSIQQSYRLAGNDGTEVKISSRINFLFSKDPFNAIARIEAGGSRIASNEKSTSLPGFSVILYSEEDIQDFSDLLVRAMKQLGKV